MEWVAKVSQNFPDTQFRIAYCNGGNGYAGYQTIRDGQKISEFVFTEEWWEEKGEEGSNDWGITDALEEFITAHNLKGIGG